jgi:phosphatidate phosphatase APP1
VGDSGERDPEIYGGLARTFPDQVSSILIRNVTDQSADDPRYRDAFRGVPRERWRIFDDAAELADVELPPP